jgi:hypothetical protein
MRIVELPAQHAHAAGSAGASLAAVRQIEMLAERRGEHRLFASRLEFPVRWKQPDFHSTIMAKERPRHLAMRGLQISRYF